MATYTRQIIFVNKGISRVTNWQLPPQIIKDMFNCCQRRITQEGGPITVGMSTMDGAMPVNKQFQVTNFALTADGTLLCDAIFDNEDLYNELENATFTLAIVPNADKTGIELKNIGWFI